MTRLLAALVLTSTVAAMAEPPRDWCRLPEDPGAGYHVPNLWTDGIVPFQFDNQVTEENKDRMYQAMCSIEDICGVRFKAWQGQANYIYIINSEEPYNYSEKVGMAGGKQDVAIISWNSHYIIVHELMHALGAWHEQQRSDRDAYIEILEDNIEEGAESQFSIKEGQWIGVYDFDSVMHYSACAFSTCQSCDPMNDNCATMKVKPPYYNQWQDKIGQRDHLSDGDKAFLTFLYAEPVEEWAYTATMVPMDGEPLQYFGFSVAADGGLTAAGAPGQDFNNEFDNDAAYLFSAGGVQTEKFRELGWEGDSYGRSVAMENDYLYVGAPPHGWNFYGDYGHVWVYDLTGVQLPTVIELPDTEAYKGYGHAVDAYADRLVVAAPLYNPFDFIPSIDWGAAYIYETPSLILKAKVTPSDAPDEYIDFGRDVATDANYVLVSAPQGNNAEGAVYVYDADSGAELHKLAAGDPAPYDGFGVAFDVEDGIAVVGALGDTHNGVHKCGSAYVFNAGTGQQLMKLVPADSSVNQFFGRSVAISDGKVIIGASGDSEQSLGAGAAYVFDLETGEELIKFTKPCGVGGAGDSFGFSVAADGDAYSIGALHENGSAGAVYRFTPNESPCYADFNQDGSISILDFLAFQTAWKNHSPAADCNMDQAFTILDFICFKGEIDAGCD